MVFWTIPSAYRILFIGIPDSRLSGDLLLGILDKNSGGSKISKETTFFLPWEMEIDIACHSMLYRTNYDQPPFYKDFRTCWYKGVDLHVNPEWDATKGPTSFARIFFWTPCWELIAFACHPEPLKVSQYFHVFSHNCSTIILVQLSIRFVSTWLRSAS